MAPVESIAISLGCLKRARLQALSGLPEGSGCHTMVSDVALGNAAYDLELPITSTAISISIRAFSVDGARISIDLPAFTTKYPVRRH